MSLQKLILEDKKYSPEAIEQACKFLDTIITSYEVIVEIVQHKKVSLQYIIDEKPAKIAIEIAFYPDGKIELIDYIANHAFYFQKQSEVFYIGVFGILGTYNLKQL